MCHSGVVEANTCGQSLAGRNESSCTVREARPMWKKRECMNFINSKIVLRIPCCDMVDLICRPYEHRKESAALSIAPQRAGLPLADICDEKHCDISDMERGLRRL